jgi:hypothetical protein
MFGEVPQPQSIAELLQFVSKHAGIRRNVYFWRGQPDIDWPIHSTAYRRLKRTEKNVTEDAMQRYEAYLLDHATHQGYRLEEGRMLSDFELLAKLRHHGAATRLVDFTRNLVAALWFSCSSAPDRDGLLLGVHSDHVGGGENQPESRKYKEIFEGIKHVEHPQTWQPPVVSKRIAAQGAQFLYSAISKQEMGSLCINRASKAHIAMCITSRRKRAFLGELAGTFDVRYLTLFPDLDGFAYAHSARFDEYENERW